MVARRAGAGMTPGPIIVDAGVPHRRGSLMRKRTMSPVFKGLLIVLVQSFVLSGAGAQEPDATWSTIARLAPSSLLLDGAIVGEKAVAVGERGHVLVSEDGGQNWQQIRVPTRATLTGVNFLDADNGWAVGHDAVILKTTDGGRNWVRVHFAPDEERPLLDLWFESPDRGIAIGAYGYYLETSDGGETWEDRLFEVVDPTREDEGDQDEEESGEISIAEMSDFLDDEDPISDLHLNEIREAEDGTLYIAAEAGHIFRSDDSGETWQMLPSPYEGSFYGPLPLSGDRLLLFGLRGRLFYSADRGESWATVDALTDAILMNGRLLEDGRPVIVGLGGTLLVAPAPFGDEVPVFELLQQEDRKAIATAIQNSAGELILIGEDGVKKLVADEFETNGN